MQSHVSCTGIKITPAKQDGYQPPEQLLVQITVDCPVCGRYRLEIAGHHLRSVRDAIIQMIDLHPTLTGTDADVKVLEKLQFGQGAPPQPENN